MTRGLRALSLGSRVVYTYLVMDILHPGHLQMLQAARRLAGDDGIVIAGILTDEAAMERKARPILSFEDRIEIAKAIKYVDCAVAQLSYSPVDNVAKYLPTILVESDDHTPSDLENSRVAIESVGGALEIIPYFRRISSTKIKAKIMATESAR